MTSVFVFDIVIVDVVAAVFRVILVDVCVDIVAVIVCVVWITVALSVAIVNTALCTLMCTTSVSSPCDIKRYKSLLPASHVILRTLKAIPEYDGNRNVQLSGEKNAEDANGNEVQVYHDWFSLYV